MDIGEWAEHYIKHRDLFEHKIEKIEKKGDNQLIITQKDSVTYTCLVIAELDEGLLPNLATQEKVLLITTNLKENVHFVVKHWKDFSAHEGLKIVFAHAAKNEKWVLIPHGHAKVAESASLKTGLLTMHKTVPEG
ncbi:hypothetical protein GOV07_02875 [Candidatus Woesearchaeota archaeon]|nr:hypothetical protein [Candidatus Woesearchaeota archaeon]